MELHEMLRMLGHGGCDAHIPADLQEKSSQADKECVSVFYRAGFGWKERTCDFYEMLKLKRDVIQTDSEIQEERRVDDDGLLYVTQNVTTQR